MSTLILDATTKTIKVNMSAAAATTNPDFTVSYADNNSTNFVEAANDGVLTGTTDAVVVAAPATGYRRIIKGIFIENKDTAAVTITVKYDNNGTQRTIAKVTLNVGDTWSTDGTYDTNGALKQTLGVVNLSSVTGTLAVANGGTGATTSSGTGSVVLATSPTLTTPVVTNPTITNYVETVYTASTSTAITVSLANGTVQILTLTANTTITMPTAVAGKSFVLILRQDATGSRTVTWTTVNWPAGTAPTITSTLSKQDIFSFFSDGTSWYGTTIGQNYTQ
jgi:hypothetical protein